MKKFLFVFSIIFVGAWFLSEAGNVSADEVALNLPGAKFGESCGGQSDCQIGLQCFGNTCVECINATICNDRDGGRCKDGVCVSPGGNRSGGLCAAPSHCASGECFNNVCKAGGSVSTTTTTDKSGGGNPLGGFPGEDIGVQDVARIIIGFACWLARIASLLAVIFVIWAGLGFMASGGDPKKYQSAKDNFKTVLWGILVVYGVYVIIATVANAVGITDFSFIPLVC